jgi:signal transduction histidine kinase
MKTSKSPWVLLMRVGLMVGATSALGLAFWSPLRSEERVHARRVIKGLTRSVQTDIADEALAQIQALTRFAELLTFEQGPSEKDWAAQAKLFMKHHPGYFAFDWVDPAYRVRWSASDTENLAHQKASTEVDVAVRRAMEEVRYHREGEAEFTPAFRLANGSAGRHIVVPIGRGGDFRGFVVATIDEQKTLANILTDHEGLDYAIAVLDGDEEVYRMPGSGAENEKAWAQDAEVQLPGATWRIRVWPEPKMLGEIGPDLSEIALLMGSLIGLLLFLTLDFARTSYFRSKELGRARDELESRVKQRTAELQLSNKALEGEIGERKEAEESLQELSRRLLQLRDEEQRRIARDLHDSTVQIMGALAIDLEKAQLLAPTGDRLRLQKLLASSGELVERATSELRTISFLLHPPILDDLGLQSALAWYANGFSSRSGIQVGLEVETDLGRLPHELELTLFRIVQEALTNVHRHSASPTVEITVHRDVQGVTLQIADHGHGMPPGTAELVRNGRAVVGVGIAGMRERVRQLGGHLEIESGVSGTLIRATLPFVTIGLFSEQDSTRGNETVRAGPEQATAIDSVNFGADSDKRT